MNSNENKKIVVELKIAITPDIHEQALKKAREVALGSNENINEESSHEQSLRKAREVALGSNENINEESSHEQSLKKAREVTIKSLREKHHDDNISTNKNKIN